MQVGSGILGVEVVPVTRVGGRFAEVAVFDKDLVCVEACRELFAKTRVEGTCPAVSFGDDKRRAVEAGVSHYKTLFEMAFGGIFVVEGLFEHHGVALFVEPFVELFDRYDSFEGYQFVIEFRGCRKADACSEQNKREKADSEVFDIHVVVYYFSSWW